MRLGRVIMIATLTGCVTASLTDGTAYASAVPNTWDCSASDPGSGCATSGYAPMPTPRHSVAVATGVDGRIYVFGGFANGNTLGTVEAYDPTANHWSCSTGDAASGCFDHSLSPLPTARAGMVAVTGVDGRIYVIGGDSNAGFTDFVEAYEPNSGHWFCSTDDSALSCFSNMLAPMPTARFAMGATLGPDGRIYVIGGDNASEQDVVEAYDTGANQWDCSGNYSFNCAASDLKPLPTPRAGLGVAMGSDGRIYTVGGEMYDTVNSVFNYFDDVEAYDVGTQTWTCSHSDPSSGCSSTSIRPLPTARSDMGVATGLDGRIYAMGGQDASTSTYSVVEAYDPVSNSWLCTSGGSAFACASTSLASMPTARVYGSAVLGPDSRIFSIGGYGGGEIGQIESYTPVPTVFINPGWNLISLPIAGIAHGSSLASTLDSALGSGSAIRALATYANGTFHVYVPAYTSDITLAAPQGIFALSQVAGLWRAAGAYFTTGQTVTLRRGWNLAAAPYPYRGLTTDTIARQIDPSCSPGPCSVAEVAADEGGGYMEYRPGTSTSHFLVPSTFGMWVESTRTTPTNWTPT